MFITFISPPLLAIFLQKRQIQLPPPCTKFMEHWCLPHEGAFFCFSDYSFPAPFSHLPPAGFPLHIFHLCFHLPLDCLTCCVPGSLWILFFHLSIHYSLFCHLFWSLLPCYTFLFSDINDGKGTSKTIKPQSATQTPKNVSSHLISMTSVKVTRMFHFCSIVQLRAELNDIFITLYET